MLNRERTPKAGESWAGFANAGRSSDNVRKLKILAAEADDTYLVEYRLRDKGVVRSVIPRVWLVDTWQNHKQRREARRQQNRTADELAGRLNLALNAAGIPYRSCWPFFHNDEATYNLRLTPEHAQRLLKTMRSMKTGDKGRDELMELLG